MAEVFNPYLEWLGIRDSRRPPSHYRLLGIDPEEHDPRIIANAGDGVIARVRSYRPGGHVVEWQELLDELQAAKLCLLDADRKQRYDIELTAAQSDERPREPSAATPIETPAAIASTGVPTEPNTAAATSSGLGFMWPPGLEPPSSKPAEAAYPSYPPRSAATDVVETTPMNAAPMAGVKFPSDYAAASAPVASVVAPQIVAPPSMLPTSYAPGAGMGFNPITPNPMAPVSSNPPPGVALSMGYPTAPNPMTPNPMAPFGTPASSTNWPPGSYPGMPIGNMPLGPQPVVSRPIMAQPVMAQPVISQPIMAQPVMVQSVAQPVAQAITSQTVTAQSSLNSMDLGGEISTNPSVKPSSSLKYRKSVERSSTIPVAALGIALLLIVVAVVLSTTDKPSNDTAHKDLTAASKPKSANSSKSKTNSADSAANKSPAKLHTFTASEPRPQTEPAETVDLVSLDPTDQPKSEEMPAENPEPNVGDSDNSAPEEQPNDNPAPTPEPENPTKPEVPVKPDPAPPAEPDAIPSQEQETAWRKAMAQTLRALGEHDLASAQTQLELAAKAAVSTVQKDRVEGLRTVTEGVQNYWNAVHESLKGLQTGDEIMIGTTRAAVVESSEDTLIIHAGGKNRRYDVKNLSLGIANFLAERWFDANAPSTGVSLGAIQFVDPNGDRAEAKRLWESAGSRGQQVEHLLPLLNEDFTAGAADADAGEKP